MNKYFRASEVLSLRYFASQGWDVHRADYNTKEGKKDQTNSIDFKGTKEGKEELFSVKGENIEKRPPKYGAQSVESAFLWLRLPKLEYCNNAWNYRNYGSNDLEKALIGNIDHWIISSENPALNCFGFLSIKGEDLKKYLSYKMPKIPSSFKWSNEEIIRDYQLGIIQEFTRRLLINKTLNNSGASMDTYKVFKVSSCPERKDEIEFALNNNPSFRNRYNSGISFKVKFIKEEDSSVYTPFFGIWIGKGKYATYTPYPIGFEKYIKEVKEDF